MVRRVKEALQNPKRKEAVKEEIKQQARASVKEKLAKLRKETDTQQSEKRTGQRKKEGGEIRGFIMTKEVWSILEKSLIVLKQKDKDRRRWRFRLKKTKLNYRFYNPNSAEDTANFLCKLLIEANRGKVEWALKRAALQDTESDAYIELEQEKEDKSV